MLMNEMVKATGRLTIEIFSSSGLLKEKVNVPNLVVTTGRNYIASRMTGATPAVMSHMAVGTGTTEPVIANTTLETELTRVALDSQNTAANVSTYIATYAAGVATGAITEAGIFNASGAGLGTLLCRTVFGVVTKAVDDIMVITWNVTIS
jgi:hypothetical protein